LQEKQTQLQQLSAAVTELEDIIRLNRHETQQIEYLVQQSEAIGQLPPPPQFHSLDPLQILIRDLINGQQVQAAFKAQIDILSSLVPPAPMKATGLLEQVMQEIRATMSAIDRASQQRRRLESLSPPPRTADTAAIAAIVAEWSSLDNAIQDYELQLEQLDGQIGAIKESILEWANENPICPTCRSPVDAGRLLSRSGGVPQ
jgi:hypothetical protein